MMKSILKCTRTIALSNGLESIIGGSGNYDHLEMWLSMGFNPDKIGLKSPYDHLSPLQYAVLKEDVDAVMLMLEYGADPNYGYPVEYLLSLQPTKRRNSILQLLLREGGRCRAHKCPIREAIWSHNSYAVSLFRNRGYVLRDPDALDYALRNGMENQQLIYELLRPHDHAIIWIMRGKLPEDVLKLISLYVFECPELIFADFE